MAVIHINEQSFEKLQASGKPFLVNYWAPWCVYCRRIGPAYEKIAEQFEGELIVAKVNIDDEPALATKERIEVIPTLVLYKGGEALGSVVAPESKAAIEEFIQELM
jgi:thioredoxin